MHKIRHEWKTVDTRTITLEDIYDSADDFIEGIGGPDAENVEELTNIFNFMYNLYGDRYLIWNTKDYVDVWLPYVVKDEFEKWEKANEIWDSQIEKLQGTFAETNIFNIGDRLEVGDDYDKFKAARSTNSQTYDLVSQIERIQDMKTPFEKLLKRIAKRIFLPHQPKEIRVED